MEKCRPDIDKIDEVQSILDEIQNQLLHYRIKTDNPPKYECELKGRIFEIFGSIIATGEHIGIDINDVVEYAKKLQEEQEDDLKNTYEWEVLHAIKGGEENEKLVDAPEEISITEIVSRMGTYIEDSDATGRSYKTQHYNEVQPHRRKAHKRIS